MVLVSGGSFCSSRRRRVCRTWLSWDGSNGAVFGRRRRGRRCWLRVSVGLKPFPVVGPGLIVRRGISVLWLVRLTTAERPAASFYMFVLAEQTFAKDELSDGPVDWLYNLFRCVAEVV